LIRASRPKVIIALPGLSAAMSPWMPVFDEGKDHAMTHAANLRIHRLPFILLALVLAFGLLITIHGVVNAQDDEPTFPLLITKFDCETDPGPVGQADLPEGCVGVEGVDMTVFDSDDNVLGSCTTDEFGNCTVDVVVPDDSLVYVEEDTSTATDGYTPRENPVEVEITNEFSEAHLINIRDTEELPDTGAGVTSQPAANIAGLLAATAALFVLGGLAVRRSDRT
jgi:hypothetical protein